MPVGGYKLVHELGLVSILLHLLVQIHLYVPLGGPKVWAEATQLLVAALAAIATLRKFISLLGLG
jgi:hypothetical protein